MSLSSTASLYTSKASPVEVLAAMERQAMSTPRQTLERTAIISRGRKRVATNAEHGRHHKGHRLYEAPNAVEQAGGERRQADSA